MAKHPVSNSNRPGQRSKPSQDKTWISWLIGVALVVFLVFTYLFSRNQEKERHENGQPPTTTRSEPRTVKMRQEHGVYFIPARINGQELEFVFDTGASGVLISQVEASLLWKQGRLKEEDIRGTVQSCIADGSIVHNTAIVLRTVEVAGLTLYDVDASVSSNATAPLLLGQSVMSRFGSFTMDYKNNTVTFR